MSHMPCLPQPFFFHDDFRSHPIASVFIADIRRHAVRKLKVTVTATSQENARNFN